MPSGDGLVVRLRITGSAISPRLGRLIAGWAVQFGNGRIDLSARANLHLRGVTEQSLPLLQTALSQHQLLDTNAAAEAVRNVIASPLAGIDPSSLADIRPIVCALEDHLQLDDSLHRLPGKFGFLVDDGGRLPLAPDTADIALVARRGETAPEYEIYLSGEPAGVCEAGNAVATIARLARSFLDLRGDAPDAPRRMAQMVRRIGVLPILAKAGLPVPDGTASRAQNRTGPARPLGIHSLGKRVALGLGIPFGQLDAGHLKLLADEAEAANGELRLTPWRVILLTGEHLPTNLAGQMQDAGFILDEASPLRAVAACAGRPACSSGLAEARADGAHLAPLARLLAPKGVTLHVSGCSKGCAHPGKAPVTLVGCGYHYDVVFNGTAGDTPVIQEATLPTIEALLQRLLTIDSVGVKRES
jgi:precorrin-3B synthase